MAPQHCQDVRKELSFCLLVVAVLCVVCCIALWLEISLEYVLRFKKKVNLPNGA